jgi:ubiquinone biosynthesis protein UbiJ
VTAPHFTILTQQELTIDLSRPAMEWILKETGRRLTVPVVHDDSVECEIDNFRNALLNLLERSEPEISNLDLIGD